MTKGTGKDPGATSVSSVGLPPRAAPTNHGKTSAAWVTTYVIILGGVLCTFGAIFQSMILIVGGAVVLVLGMVVGRIMQAMGFGQRGEAGSQPHKSPSPRR